MRQSIFSRLAGYEDTNDAERLSVDPVLMRATWLVDEPRNTRRPFHQPDGTVRRTEVLTQPGNLEGVDEAIREMD